MYVPGAVKPIKIQIMRLKSGSNAALGIGIALLFVALVLLAGGVALLGRTLVAWWIPAAIAAVPAIATAMPMMPRWQFLFGFSKPLYALPFHLFTVGAITFFLFLGINRWCADKSTAHTEQTTVVEKFRKEHTRYRRVGRNRRVPDGHYHTWHLKLQFSDGRTKDMEVPFTTYRNAREGSHRELTVERGLFGMTVID